MKIPQIHAPLKEVYLLAGGEVFLIEEQLSSVRALLGDNASMNSSWYHAQEIKRAEEIVELCNTMPFLSDRRLIVIRNIHKLGQKEQGRITAYLERPCSSTTLILTIEGAQEREEKNFTKGLPRGAEVLRFDTLKGRDLHDWIAGRVRVYGKTMDRDAVYLLAEVTGSNVWFIASEIEKLSLYIGSRPAITIKDVEYLVMKSHEPPVFAFMDSLFDRKKDSLLRLHELEYTGISELEMISRIENQIVQHYQVLCTRKGRPPGMHPFVEKKILTRGSLWNAPQLTRLLSAIRRIEQGIKSGRTLHPYAAIHEAILGVIFPA